MCVYYRSSSLVMVSRVPGSNGSAMGSNGDFEGDCCSCGGWTHDVRRTESRSSEREGVGSGVGTSVACRQCTAFQLTRRGECILHTHVRPMHVFFAVVGCYCYCLFTFTFVMYPFRVRSYTRATLASGGRSCRRGRRAGRGGGG